MFWFACSKSFTWGSFWGRAGGACNPWPGCVGQPTDRIPNNPEQVWLGRWQETDVAIKQLGSLSALGVDTGSLHHDSSGGEPLLLLCLRLGIFIGLCAGGVAVAGLQRR